MVKVLRVYLDKTVLLETGVIKVDCWFAELYDKIKVRSLVMCRLVKFAVLYDARPITSSRNSELVVLFFDIS